MFVAIHQHITMATSKARLGRGKLIRSRVVNSNDSENNLNNGAYGGGVTYFYHHDKGQFTCVDTRLFVDPKNKECSEWSMYFPEACGNNQSPIELISKDAVFDQSLADKPLKFNYSTSRETEILNNGYTLVVFPRPKQVDSGLRIESIGRSVFSGGPLGDDIEYELSEIRFHWGRDCDRGSEHVVNGKAFPMEIQLVHWNSQQYASIEQAIGRANGIAIVSMFGQIGREHSGLRVIVDALEDVLYKGRQKTLSGPFNPQSFLPDPALWDFWSYPGSLTTPPCSENVTWILLRYPLMLSSIQLESFRRLCTFSKGDKPHAGHDGFMVDNFRPTQEMNGRVIKASFQS